MWFAGLIHNVIAESGSSLEHWAFEEEPLGASYIIAERVGCLEAGIEPDLNDEKFVNELASCLYEADERELLMALTNLVVSDFSDLVD